MAQEQEPDAPKCSPGPEKETWTSVHGFFVLMGGIVFREKPDRPEFFPLKSSGEPVLQYTLTLDGFRYLLNEYPSLIPDLGESEIQDKSKSSAFAKTLVCIQGMALAA
jgi:hypothetical protein